MSDTMCCTLCPRACRARRSLDTGGGVCGMPAAPVIAQAALHRWEEPCLAGEHGAGAVFFSGCSLSCVYCQNEKISRGRQGADVSVARLREIFRELAAQGAATLDLVSPTPYLPWILEALAGAGELPPVVWNSSGYETPETLAALAGKVQIYLPDYKYAVGESARSLSAAADYPAVARAAIRAMYRQTGPLCWGEDGLLRRGVIIRHLLLPGRLAEAKLVMDWVAENFPPGGVLFSLMSQYVPCGRALELPALARPLRAAERRAARDYMAALGLAGYVQEADSARAAYIPPFDGRGVLSPAD